VDPGLDLGHSFGRKGKSRARRKPKCVRLGEILDNLVFGEEVEMEQVVFFSEHMVVARARGCRFELNYLHRWVKTHWGGNLTAKPIIHILSRGWMAFTIGTKEEVDWVLSNQWEMAKIPVGMKKWTPMFDAQREVVECEPIWVRLLGYPMLL